MSLEEKTKEFMLEGDYDRDKFVKTGKKYQDLSKWINTLQKDNYNVDVMRKAGKALKEDPDFYYQSGTSPRPILEDTFSELIENRARYVKEKYSNIISGFKEEDWMGLISQLPLYKTGKKEYDEKIDFLNKLKEISEAGGDLEKMIKFLSKKFEKFDSILKSEFNREMYNERYVKVLFGIYQRKAQAEYSEKFLDKEGELKKGLAKSIFEESLRTAEKEMEAETDEGTKNDIWEDDIRQYYLALNEIKYKIEKKELEEEKEKKEDLSEKERKKKRKGIGMKTY